MVLRVMNWKRRRKVPVPEGFSQKSEPTKSVKSVERDVERHIDFYDGGEHVDADGDPDLSFHRVFGRAIEMFDAQILLHPFKKQFHSPTFLIERGDHLSREREVVGQEHKMQPCFWIAERDAP